MPLDTKMSFFKATICEQNSFLLNILIMESKLLFFYDLPFVPLTSQPL